MDSQLFHNDRGSGQSSNPGSGSYGDGNNNNNFDQHNTIRNSSFGLGNFGGIDHSSNINANTNANKYPNFSSNDFPALGAGGNVNSNDNTNNNGIVGGSNSNNNNSSSSSSSSSSSNNNMNNNGGSLGVGTFGARRGVNGDYTTDNKDFSMMADDFPSLHTSLSGSGNSSGNVNAPTDDVLKLSGGYHEKIIKNQGGGIISSSNSNNSISNSTMMDKNNNNNNNKLIGQFGNIHSQGDNSKNNNGSDDSNGNNNNLMQNNMYNLLGLLSVIEMTDNDINLLMLGSDLTTYGLNLNSADVLYPSFSSPFNDQASIGAQYVTPKCYHMPISLFRFEHLSKLQLETLFYMFYAMPRDILQAHAAKELYRRDWKYHGELRVWLKPRPPQELAAATTEGAYPVPFMYFDANIFETKPFTATYRGNIASGLLSEEEVKAISVPSK